MAIKEEGNLNSAKDTNTVYTILAGMQEDLFELQRQIDEMNGGEPAPEVSFDTTTITKLDATNFEIVVVAQNGAEINKVDVTITDLGASSGAAVPESLTLENGVLGEGGEKTFTMSMLTFEDPSTAVGESYDLLLNGLDIGNASVYSEEQAGVVIA